MNHGILLTFSYYVDGSMVAEVLFGAHATASVLHRVKHTSMCA
jgi:hypothetical protein